MTTTKTQSRVLALLLALLMVFGTLPGMAFADSSAARLTGLSLSGGTLTPDFSPETTEYSVTVENDVASIGISPRADADTFIKVGLVPLESGKEKNYNLYVGDNYFQIDTHREGGQDTRYTLVVTRKDQNRLVSLSGTYTAPGAAKTTKLSLTPGFSGGTTAYTAEIPKGVTELSLSTGRPFSTGDPWKQEGHQTVTITNNGTVLADHLTADKTTIPLDEGENAIKITVDSIFSGSTTYDLTVKRQEASTAAAEENLTAEEDLTAEEVMTAEEDMTADDERNAEEYGAAEGNTGGEEAETGAKAEAEAKAEGDEVLPEDDLSPAEPEEEPVLLDDSLPAGEPAKFTLSLKGAEKGMVELEPGKTDYTIELDYITKPADRDLILEVKEAGGTSLPVVINRIPKKYRTFRMLLGSQEYHIQAGDTAYVLNVIMKDVETLSSINLSDDYETNISTMLVPEFSEATTEYTLTLADVVDKLTLKSLGVLDSQIVTVNGERYASGMELNIPEGASQIVIRLQSTFSGEKTYTINITRLQRPEIDNSLNAALDYYVENPALTLKTEVLAQLGAGRPASELQIVNVPFSIAKADSDQKLDLAQSVIAVTALGGDPQSWQDKDFAAALIGSQSNGGLFNRVDESSAHAMSVMAMYVGGLEYAGDKKTLEGALSGIRGNQAADGSFAVGSNYKSKCDLIEKTASSILALVPYRSTDENQAAIDKAIDKAIAYLKNVQTGDGFRSTITAAKKRPSAISTAMVISALTAAGEDVTSAEWTKDGVNLKQALEAFQLPGGGFRNYIDEAEADKEATSLALLALGDIANKSSAWLKFQPAPSGDADIVTRDAEMLSLGDTTSVTRSLRLPLSGNYGSTITWKSSNTKYLADDGIVTRPALGAPNETVTLTAVLVKGSETKTKEFTVVIRAMDPPADVSDMIKLAKNYYDGYCEKQPGSWWDLGAILSCWGSLDGYAIPDYSNNFVGSQPSEYVGRILGVIAAGGNPYKTLSGQNLVKDMITKYGGSDGSFGIINQHMWSVIALNAANAEGVYNDSNPSKLYKKTEAVQKLIAMQNASTGSIGGLDLTGMALIALAGSREVDGVEAAIDKALNYLENTQVTAGKYKGGWGENNSDTLAAVLSGLAAVGENPTGERWTVDGVNPLMVLKLYQITDPNEVGYGGFVFKEGQGLSDMSSYHAIIALGDIAATESVWTKIKYTGTIDDSTTVTLEQLNAEIAAAKAVVEKDYTAESYAKMKQALTGAEETAAKGPSAAADEIIAVYTALSEARSALVRKPAPDPGPDDPTISVSFTIRGDRKMGELYSGTVNRLAENASVWDALQKVASAENIDLKYRNQYNTVYVEAIDGLEEFDNGPYSGWKYKVNGTYPPVGCAKYKLESGDTVVWTYTDDYTKGDDYWKPQDGGSSGGGSGSGTVETKPEVTTEMKPQVTTDKNGEAKAEISEKDLTSALEQARKDKATALVISPQVKGEASKVSVVLPKNSAESISKDKTTSLIVSTKLGELKLESGALKSAVEQAKGSTIVISILKKNAQDLKGKLEEAALKDAGIAEVTVASGDKQITSFGDAALLVSIPVSSKFTAGNGYKVLVLSGDGTLETVSGTCVKSDGALSVQVKTAHLSTFAATTEKTMPFTDVSGHWAATAIEYAYAKGLMSGTGRDRFDPDGTVDRAMMVTVLYNAENSPAVTGKSPFTDVAPGQWYTNAVIWAQDKKIVSGVGGGRFGANDAITREQLATMLQNYAKFKGYDVSKTKELASFGDAAAVSSWALPSMKWANAEGIINGRTASTLAPSGTATRAEMASMLMQFLEKEKK